MSTTLLPNPKDIRDLLGDLVDRGVDVTPGEPMTATPRPDTALACYVDPYLGTLAICLLDLPLAAMVSAALNLLPAGAAEDAVAEKALTPMLIEALQEVANVLSVLFNTPGAPHAKLYAVYPPGEAVPDDLLSLAASLGRRIDLSVKVTGYGAGRFAVVLADN